MDYEISDNKLIIECVNCHKNLRIPDIKKILKVTCPLCKHEFVVDHGKIQSSNNTKNLFKESIIFIKNHLGISLFFLGLIILLAIIAIYSQSKLKPAYQKHGQTITGSLSLPNLPQKELSEIPSKQSILPNMPLPKSGTLYRYASGDYIARLHVSTSAGSHYFIKVEDYGTGQPIACMFIRSGQSAQMKVPLGSFTIKYATGNNWHGKKYLFGPETSAFKCEKKFDFYLDGEKVHGYRVELIKQPGGNLNTRDIPVNEF